MTVILWRDLDPDERSRLSASFIQLAADRLTGLGDDEFYLFAQWIYGRQHDLMARSVAESSGLADFTFQLPDGKQELLRVYATERVPMAVLYGTLKSVEGQGYQKVSLYLRARKSAAEAKLQPEFSFAFEVVDINGLRSRLVEAQRQQPRRPARAPGTPQPAKPRTGGKPARRRRWSPRLLLVILILLVIAVGVLIFVLMR